MPSKEQKRQSARKEKLWEVAAAKKAAKEAALQAATASQSPEPGNAALACLTPRLPSQLSLLRRHSTALALCKWHWRLYGHCFVAMQCRKTGLGHFG